MMKEIADKGVELYQMPQDQQTQWFTLFQAETKKWVSELEAKGLPATEAVMLFNEETHKHDVSAAAFPVEWGKK
jgi:hypothetical protein